MKLVMHDGEVKVVDTSFIFNNQYNTTDGKRVSDRDVKYIIDDVRLGEFYCCSKKQGTYDEVAKAIADERAKINKCSECWWFHEHTRIENECHRDRKETIEGNKKTIIVNEKTVYELSCGHKPKYGGKCVHDIEEAPVLFRKKSFCFFCEYPNGIPDMKPLRQFMIDNAEKYGIVPYWSNQELHIDNSFTHKKLFGSYKFEASKWGNCFELVNSRNRFRFYVDMVNKKYILADSIGYKVRKYLGEDKYNSMTHKSSYEPIVNYDKFATWFWQIVDDFMATK